jgi:hypothetical protein
VTERMCNGSNTNARQRVSCTNNRAAIREALLKGIRFESSTHAPESPRITQ